MRKSSAVLATFALIAAALTGCAATPSFDGVACDRAAATSGLEDVVEVSGEVGSKPKAELFTPVGAESSAFSDIVVGTGPALTSPTQSAVVEFSLFSGATGEEILATPYDEGQERLVSVGYWAQQLPAFGTALECATGGSRIVSIITPEDFGEANLLQFGLEADDPVVAIFDVVKTYPGQAQGALQYNDVAGMPVVVRAPDGRPGVIVPDSAPPTELQVQTLIKGDGKKISNDDSILVNYTGVTWDEHTVFDSSWDRGAATFDMTRMIPGFAQGLAGQTVGSQVLIVIPPELGYGEEGNGPVPANATLVFVVDILGIDPPAAPQQ